MFPRPNLLTRLLKRTKKKRNKKRRGSAEEVTNSENVFDGNTKVKTMEKTAPSVTGTAPTDEEKMIDEDVEDQNDESNTAPADEEQMIDKVAENQDDASDTRLSRRARWMLSHRLGWLYRLPGEWPRTIALIFGVIFPLFLLIVLSLFFGYGLAKMEAPEEIVANNEIIANRARVDVRTKFRNNVTTSLPEICFEIFTQDLPMNETFEKEFEELSSRILDRETFNVSLTRQSIPELTANETLELLEFLPECGKIGLDIASKFTSLADLDYESIGESLSFNWIRCDGDGLNSTASKLYNQIWGRPFVDRDRLKPDAQAATAILEWRISNRELYDEYLESLRLENGTLQIGARSFAFRQALAYADGFSQCYPNSAAGAWFWFTVMTTIGYGNTAPTSEGGRAMIYTLGFFSILLFAVILGTAGKIVVTIWDDFIDRTKLHQLNIPWVACLFWGCCYYSWMLVIAVVTQNWKAARLGQETDFGEAYWYAYISTTTVGLGDYYLEHDVILRQDLFIFPVLFLAGFVLLANFFVKLTEIVLNLVPHSHKTLEDTLAESKVPCMPDHVKKGIKAISAFDHSSKRRAPAARAEKNDESDRTRDDVEVSSAVAVQRGDSPVSKTTPEH